MSTATLTKPESPTREDGVEGYAVTLMGKEETSERIPVRIVTHFCSHGTVTLSVDRAVTLVATGPTNRVVVFSERDTEMIARDVHMPKGGTVVVYPAGQNPGHLEGFTEVT